MGAENLNNIPPPPPPTLEKPEETPLLKERAVASPEEHSAREFSKNEMATERAKLAAEIKQERKEGRDKVAELRVRINLLKTKLEQSGTPESIQDELEKLETERTERANSLTGRVKSFLNIEAKGDKDSVLQQEELTALKQEQEEAAEDLKESMGQLADADAGLAALKEKITGHYTEAGGEMRKTVEQTILRNSVFLVHTINENPALRHNENSNVAAEATFDDDLDILLALEPSLSASSIQSGADEEGRVSGLWSHSGGVLVSGGRIAAGSEQDVGTLSKGIKSRHAFSDANKSAEQIDAIVQAPRRSTPGELGGYNELVVDNPEISGYFKSGAVDERGVFWANTLDTRSDLEKIHELYERSPSGAEYRDELGRFNRNLNRFRERFDQIKARGMPFYVMTPDRRFFEVNAVRENGSLETGTELTPEQAARGRAGLPPEKRKEIGKNLLERKVFRNESAQREAEQIIDGL